MKKLFVVFEILGFVVMLGAAGSADNNTISFLQALVMEFCGIAVMLLSASGHCYYKKYCRNKKRRKIAAKDIKLVNNSNIARQTVEA